MRRDGRACQGAHSSTCDCACPRTESGGNDDTRLATTIEPSGGTPVTGEPSSRGAANVAGEQLLQRLNAALVREAQADVIVRAAIDALVTEVGAHSAAVFFLDEEAGVARPDYTVNYPADVLENLREVSIDLPAFSNMAMRTGEVIVIPSRDRVPSGATYTRSLAERMGVNSSAAVPLIAGGRTLGVVVYSLAEEHDFSEGEIAMLREVGDHIAVAVERARLEDQLARRAEEAELLHSIASAAAGEDDLGRILSAALDRLSGLLRFTGGSIAVVEDDELVIRAATGTFAETALGQRLPRGTGRSWQIIQSGEPFLSNDLTAAGFRSVSSTDAQVIRSYLAVPLIWRGKPFGILEVDSLEPNVFRPSDLTLLQGVATLISGPIELASRYAAEVQLRRDLDQAKGRLESILSHAPMGIFFFDEDFCLAYANRASWETLRLLPSEELMLGRSWDDLAGLLVHRRWGDDPEQLATLIEETKALRSGILIHDFPLHSPDQMLLRIAAPVYESGRFSGHIIILMDVTTERRALAEAERAIAVRDRFMSIASHELKTPLTSIKGMAQLAIRAIEAGNADPVRLRRNISTIDFQSDRLRQLIDELLDVSRIQSGRMELRRADTDLTALVRGVVETLPEDQRRRVQLSLANEAPGRWDPLRLEQVIANLVDNALKYSPPTEPVDVQVVRGDDGVVLRVTDRGIGVPEAEQRELFEPFARAANAQSRDKSGLGLGLYITRQIVEGHGGTIGVTSRIGEGSTFTVRLPA